MESQLFYTSSVGKVLPNMAAVKNVVAGAVLRQVRSLFLASASSHFTTVPIARKIHTREVKKFYKNARIAQSNGLFEINLDKRKLRTPLGNLFQVDNESLALAVATEWNAQEDTIKQHNMYLTTLCNTVIDNPMQRTKEDLTKASLHFLETDTLCYRMLDPPDLITVQQTHWDPLVDWFRSRYSVQIETTTGIMMPKLPEHTVQVLNSQLMSYNFWGLTALCSAAECVKSLIITLALMERQIKVEDAVRLSRLETEFQIQRWGNVEWYHDLDMYDNQSRLAAAALLLHWSTEGSGLKQKASLKFGR